MVSEQGRMGGAQTTDVTLTIKGVSRRLDPGRRNRRVERRNRTQYRRVSPVPRNRVPDRRGHRCRSILLSRGPRRNDLLPGPALRCPVPRCRAILFPFMARTICGLFPGNRRDLSPEDTSEPGRTRRDGELRRRGGSSFRGPKTTRESSRGRSCICEAMSAYFSHRHASDTLR